MIALGCENLYPKKNIFAYFETVEGLEGEFEIDETQKEESYPTKCILKLINGQNFEQFENNLRLTISECEGFNIYIIDKHNDIMLEYYLFDLEIKEVQKLDNDFFNLNLICNLYKASKGVLEVCKIRINKELTEYNLWRKIKPEYRQGWLEVAINLQKLTADYENLQIQIDGSLIDNEDAFFCILGESVNGPGGYFGRNLDALIDCFRGGYFGVKLPFTLIWKNHEISKRNLGDYFIELIDVLEYCKVKIELN